MDGIDGGGAERDARQHDGAFTVRIAGASGFSLLFDRAFVPPAKTVTVRIDDGPVVCSGAAGGGLSFAREDPRWRRVPAPVTGPAQPAAQIAVVGLASRSLPRQAAHAYV